MSGTQQTSSAALTSLTDLSERQATVHAAIRALGTACNQKIADHLGIPINQVTGRVFELRDRGVVRESHRGIWLPTGRNVIWWETCQAA